MNKSPGVPAQDHRVRELSQLRLTLRSDLRFTPHFEAGQKCYLIEDAARTQFYRVGIAEYLFLSMFDGDTSVGDALIRLSQVDGDYALTEAEAVSICKWLVDSELANTPESSTSGRLAQTAVDRAIRRRMGSWNPLCMKVPLAYPDRFFARITPAFRPFFSFSGLVVGLVLVALACHRVTQQWDLFSSATDGIYSPGRWIWMGVCWVLLKIIHESAHAIVCRKYGGSVQEAGAIFVLFAPLAYVDLTSSWRFRSKWQRIHTAAAGMYVELFTAALAAIGWSLTGPGLVNDLCFNVVLMAGLTTLVFNANPLMRFDGYYILSDLLEIPNLYADAQQYLKYVGRRYVLGDSIQSPLRWSPRDAFTRLYAIAALAWRAFICVSLVIAASMLLHGFGVLLAAVAAVLWIGVPIGRLIKHVLVRDGLQRRRQSRLAIATAAICVLAYFAMGLPWPGATRAAAIVQYEPLAFVRADTGGFVRSIHVSSGQTVKAGDTIAELENPGLRAELEDLDLAIEQSLLKARVFQQEGEMHSYQAEKEQLRALRMKRPELAKQVDDLTLTAPVDGRIVARNLSLLLDTYLNEGQELAAIGDESRKELQIAVTHSDFDHFKQQLGESLSARVSGGVVLQSTLQRVDPRATKQAPHESMYSTRGGILACRRSDQEESNSDPDRGSFELVAPHFTGFAPLSPAQSQSLRVGQRGVVWFGRHDRTLGGYLQRQLRSILPQNLRWIEEAVQLGSIGR